MNKYLIETPSLQHSLTIIRQLVNTNVLLKEHSDKQIEEKRILRKKVLSMDTHISLKDKLLQTTNEKLADVENQLLLAKNDLKNKEIEIKNLTKRTEALKSTLFQSPTMLDIKRNEAGKKYSTLYNTLVNN
jgi:hypothetical protein